jgi:hypothetical protein
MAPPDIAYRRPARSAVGSRLNPIQPVDHKGAEQIGTGRGNYVAVPVEHCERGVRVIPDHRPSIAVPDDGILTPAQYERRRSEGRDQVFHIKPQTLL